MLPICPLVPPAHGHGDSQGRCPRPRASPRRRSVSPDAEPVQRRAVLAPLSGQQLLVLQLLARGYSLAQIGVLSGCAPHTLLRGLVAAMRALGARSQQEAVVLAGQRGLIV
jgi:DNA-binding NarL/FixJ family response regulator